MQRFKKLLGTDEQGSECISAYKLLLFLVHLFLVLLFTKTLPKQGACNIQHEKK
jgi:hypothetical protein